MPRPQFTDISAPEAIRPIAAPVDTYVRPADPAPSKLHELAQGLGDLAEGLGSIYAKEAEGKKQDDAAQAEADFWAGKKLGAAEAVRTGVMPAKYSPTYIKTYRKMEGDLAGTQLRVKFNEDYLKNQDRFKNDDAAFSKWQSDWIAQNVDPNADPKVLAGLVPHIQKLWTDGQEAYLHDSNEALVKNATNTAGALVKSNADAAVEQSMTSGGKVDTKGLWEDISKARAEFLEVGNKPEDYDETMVQSILLSAVDKNRPELLEVLDQKIPGTDVKYKDDPRFAPMVSKAINDMSTIGRQRIADAERLQEKADKEALLAIRTTIYRDYLTKPDAGDIPEDLLVEAEKRGWYNVRSDSVAIKKQFQDNTTAEDNSLILDLQKQAMDGTLTMDGLNAAAVSGTIRDPKTYATLADRIDKVAKEKAEGSGLLTGETTKFYRKQIIARVSTKGAVDLSTAAIASLFDDNGNAVLVSDEALQAQQDFDRGLLQWDSKNPDASVMEREEFITKWGTTVLSRIDAGADPNNSLKYTSDRDKGTQAVLQNQADDLEQADKKRGLEVQQDNQRAMDETGGQDLPVEPTADQKADADVREGRDTAALYGKDAAPVLESLPEDNRKYLAEQASKLGITPEELNVKVWESLAGKIKQGLGRSESTINMDTPKTVEDLNAGLQGDTRTTAGNMLDSMIDQRIKDGGMNSIPKSGDPVIGDLADLVGGTEGTDKGRGYNETLAYGKLTGGDVDLENMTLDEVDKLQSQMLRHKDNKWNSSALGRFQGIRTTLREWRKANGIAGTEKFDAKMQDRFFKDRLEFRGYSKWMAGKMSDEAFANSMAKEWASLPNPEGKSYYDKNNAAISREKFMAALKAHKAGGGRGSLMGEALSQTPTVPKAYAKLPKAEQAQFMEWNSDPEANSETLLKTVPEPLQKVYKAAEAALAKNGIKIVVGSGARDEEMQKKAVKWGWSKTLHSDHVHDKDGMGQALDVWFVDEDGSVSFDKDTQEVIAEAMKAAAKSLGVELDAGIDWKNPDRPHFALKK